jgi:hypothetical protein
LWTGRPLEDKAVICGDLERVALDVRSSAKPTDITIATGSNLLGASPAANWKRVHPSWWAESSHQSGIRAFLDEKYRLDPLPVAIV